MIYEDLQHHINALRCTFEIFANNKGITAEELTLIRNEIVNEHGKYETDWNNDWLAKLAFDYYFCIEMQTVLEERGELSYNRRLRLYRMVTKNEDVKKLWDELSELTPNAFLDKTERRHAHRKFGAYK